MHALTKAFPLSGLSLVTSLFHKPKPKPVPGPIQRDDLREAAEQGDMLARRRGGAADMVTGAYGAEPDPSAISKNTLGS